ncbi:MAG: response regulator [Subdoligranulum variabile]|nr:response regulator [Subdoligranulum variabile]
MMRVLIVDDEPLVLLGLQSMMDWEAHGYQICGTARNGKLALDKILQVAPDIVITDIKMPVMDGLALARACHQKGLLPVFVMLTSYEEFSYVREALGLGTVDYLIKMELSESTLLSALKKASEKVQTEQTLRSRDVSALKRSVLNYRDRLLNRLYAAAISTEDKLDEQLHILNIHWQADAYVLASCDFVLSNPDLSPEDLVPINFSTVRMMEDTFNKHLPCFVSAIDLQHCVCCFSLTKEQCSNLESYLTPELERVSRIVSQYFSVRTLWVVSAPTSDRLSLSQRYAENDLLRPMLCAETPILFSPPDEPLDPRTQTVACIQQYIQTHLDQRLSLNDIASVFNFSPKYISMLFAKYGDSGFVEYVTEMRITAAKEMLATGNYKIYEIASKLGFESADYFSRVFKRVTGLSPRSYQQEYSDD